MRLRPTTVFKLVGVVSAAVSISISTFTAIWLDRRMTEDAEAQLRRVTVVLADQTFLAFEGLDAMMRHAIEEIGHQLPTWPQVDLKALHELLEEDKAGMPQAQALLAIRADGLLIGHSREYPLAEIHTADRDYFKAQKDPWSKAGPPLFIGTTVANRINGNLMIPISRRIDKDGAFAGVVMAAMDVAYFSNLYERLYVPDRGSVYTQKTDGTVLAIYPKGTTVPRGDEYLSFSAPVDTYGLVVGMSISRETLRDYWRPAISAVVIGAIGSSVMILMLVIFAAFRMNEYARWEELRAKVKWTPEVIQGGSRDA